MAEQIGHTCQQIGAGLLPNWRIAASLLNTRNKFRSLSHIRALFHGPKTDAVIHRPSGRKLGGARSQPTDILFLFFFLLESKIEMRQNKKRTTAHRSDPRYAFLSPFAFPYLRFLVCLPACPPHNPAQADEGCCNVTKPPLLDDQTLQTGAAGPSRRSRLFSPDPTDLLSPLHCGSISVFARPIFRLSCHGSTLAAGNPEHKTPCAFYFNDQCTSSRPALRSR